ncbi:unnamed protein product [Tilletia controversa]|uniref:PITH domain-containing protein n=3 Tax=Tilletia TaxID=13289 RepID=A0A8X7MX66_9BASI|nr:hypothetical protein CF328_g4782 [Tilletia controversa]KAE8197839.1 hypothetical protein CF336_g1964 [Tilletia laevis]KAE8258314.1 hypothetical protein A4X03_0g4416 [Tilletia caries]KAE8198165.1 hypothetical protein CF335_g4447 [Tilletia laevis]KAE8252618.1 hypothetical protein A4X06_0g2056 [Tilletia controversa]
MSHDHQHCGHEHHDHGGDDDHLKPGEGQQDFLYAKIDREGVTALNEKEPGMGAKTIKPWDRRQDETAYLETDADDQTIIRIPFTGVVKLRSLFLKAGPATHTPDAIYLFPNVETMDFADAEAAVEESGGGKGPAQKLESIAVTREVVEYPLRPAKFSNVHTLTLFVPRSLGEETTRIYFLGFKGEWSDVKREGPTNIIYESAPQLKDHTKVPGTGSGAYDFGTG